MKIITLKPDARNIIKWGILAHVSKRDRRAYFSLPAPQRATILKNIQRNLTREKSRKAKGERLWI